MSDHISVTLRGPIQVIRINRAAKKNALTEAMYSGLCDAIESGDQNTAIAAHVIFGSQGVFTAGNDIADFLATSQGAGGLADGVLRFIRLLPVVAKPLIAGVDGLAVGIGTTMLLHCDLVYATPAARFATPFLNLGLVPEAASSLLMPARMGYARAFEMLVLGEAFDAEQAHQAGLVNAVVPSDMLEDTVIAAARRLADKPPAALATARRLMRGDAASVLARTEAEASAFRQCLKSPEARAAFEAFLSRCKA